MGVEKHGDTVYSGKKGVDMMWRGIYILGVRFSQEEYATLCALLEHLRKEGYVTLNGLLRREAMENIRRKQGANVYPTFTREQLQKALERRLQLRRVRRK